MRGEIAQDAPDTGSCAFVNASLDSFFLNGGVLTRAFVVCVVERGHAELASR